MNVNCDKCNKEFEMVVDAEKHGEVTEYYFICPECSERYTAYYMDFHCEKLQESIAELRERVNKNQNTKKAESYMKQIREKRKQLEKRMKKLKDQRQE